MKTESSWLTPCRALTAYTAIFSLFIIWVSAHTALDPGPHGAAVRYLALAEIGGAILFLLRATRIVGLVILLVVFSIAAIVELHLHQLPMRFIFYAGSALLVQYFSDARRLSS
jgi:hypothetical protein